MADTKKGFVPTTFNDVGTGQSFEGGKEHVFDAGAFDNYSAAGLIGEAPAKAEAPETPAKSGKD